MKVLCVMAVISILFGVQVYATYDTPYEQVRQGIAPEDVKCNNNLILGIKNDAMPACVKMDAVKLLMQIGWLDHIVHTNIQENSNADTWIPQSEIPQLYGRTSVQSGAMGASTSLGLAAGGAQNIDNFRTNIELGYLPMRSDITYEGLFYDYYFDTGNDSPCEELFCPSYTYATSYNTIYNNYEYFVAVGLNSGLDADDFKRKDLNLVIVLDTSGSMGTPFDEYYYDGMELDEQERSKTKIKIANESVAGLLRHLGPNDRLGVVLFSDWAHMARPLEGISDKNELKSNILEITSGGGTNMEAGMTLGASLFEGIHDKDHENRIIFLTDAMPNLGDHSRKGLLSIIQENSENSIHSTFIGIGVDFNTDLIDSITKVRGANYYSVHSSAEFEKQLIDEFEFMVSPLVFDLELYLESDGYEIQDVYGSPDADEATGQIMKVNTLFPSDVQGNETRGGMILLRLDKTSDDAKMSIKTTYKDINGKYHETVVETDIGGHKPDYYENDGIRKAVLLSRYAELMRAWIFEERMRLGDIRIYDIGICSHTSPDVNITRSEYLDTCHLGEWEKQSVQLVVSDYFIHTIQEFSTHIESEINEIGDDTLRQELIMLNTILADS